MYFSANEFYNYLAGQSDWGRSYVLEDAGEYKFTKRAVARIHKRAIEAVMAREDTAYYEKDGEDYYTEVWKWHRPWEVVPSLKNWQAPAGDFGVGIEIELGFDSWQHVNSIMKAVRHWKYITMDFEGCGDYPIEATFPPVCYSKFSPKSQACRYLKLVDGKAIEHDEEDMVGTHINVSVGGRAHHDSSSRRHSVNHFIESCCYGFTFEHQVKYFGRAPYGGIRSAGTHYECKMFNSVTDWKVLRRYVDISIELIKLIESEEVINASSVIAACERGYSLRS